jgi:hypothetical protein
MTAISKTLVAIVADLQAAGKTPWLTIEGDRVHGVYPSRDIARSAKTGKPVKFDGQGFELDADEATSTEAAETFALPTNGDTERMSEESLEDDGGETSSVADVDADEFSAAKDTLGDMQPTVEPVPPVVNETLKADKPDADIRRKSEIVRPTKLVWDICDAVRKANPEATRKEILEECERRGIAYYTARTQYQVWKSMQK